MTAPPSPIRIAIGSFIIAALVFHLVKTGIKPGLLDSPKWYDRAIRIVGGLMIGAVFALGFAMLLGWLRL